MAARAIEARDVAAQRLTFAAAAERAAREELAAIEAPGPGLPGIELWQKALFTGGAEFLMFGVPFAAARLRKRNLALAPRAPPTTKPQAAKPAAEKQAGAPINNGGWDARRAKYGPTGRKPRRLGGGGVVGAGLC